MGNMMFCSDKAEAIRLEIEAKARAAELLREMPQYIRAPGALRRSVQI